MTPEKYQEALRKERVRGGELEKELKAIVRSMEVLQPSPFSSPVHRLKLLKSKRSPGSTHQPPSSQPTRHE